MLVERLDWVINCRIQPEIGLEGDVLYKTSSDAFTRVANELKKARLSCTLHAPFFDLAPGSLDKKILEISRNKFRLAFNLIPIFQPQSIVCHLNFEENKHGYNFPAWFSHAAETWHSLLEIAGKHNTYLMLENTYENSPLTHIKMFEKLNSPWCRFCFDAGHVAAFAKGTWQEWLIPMHPWLGQLHLHDNNGAKDEHLPIGQGSIDFTGIFNFLAEKKLHPIVTLEPHSEAHLWQTLENLNKMDLFISELISVSNDS